MYQLVLYLEVPLYWIYAQSTGCRVLGVLGDVLCISGWVGSMLNLQDLQLGDVFYILISRVGSHRTVY